MLMDAIRVSKVENVIFAKSGSISNGTLHLTAHHIIFRYDDAEEKEMWIPYPMISQVNRLPQTFSGQARLNFHTRTFESFSLTIDKDPDAADVFESVKELTVAPSVKHLYAFFYTPKPSFPTNNGWNIYSPRDEFGRMGVGTRSKAWRFTDLNKDYSFCPTYPARLVVPTKISDTTLQYASKYRSKCRLPLLSYLHWANFGSITRSSQPMVGIKQSRSVQDEKLIEAIFQSHWSPESRVSSAPVYGATPTNLIIDARPTVNAVANTAKGAGTENMEYYKEGKKVYLGIDHIHTMRESLGKVVEALKEADQLLASINNDLNERVIGLAVLDRQALRRSGWLRHITAILEGTLIIVKNVHINSSHVLIHCSDGWDRTSQLSALAQLCLDPFYRTIRGFEILIEKDWISVGHKFLDRCGHLSSEKFFLSASADPNTGDAAQAFIASMQHRFASQNHIKETSPIFHQFLEAVRQVQRQYPERFEFNERFLRQLYYHLYSCQFGTFLFNSEKERRVGEGEPPPCERTVSIWDFFNSPAEMALNGNPLYDPTLDDPKRRSSDADMGVLLPKSKDVRFWHELYGRDDEEMNGRFVLGRDVESLVPVETAIDDEAVINRSNTPDVPQKTPKLSVRSEPYSNSQRSSPALSPMSSSTGLAGGLRDLTSSLPDLGPTRHSLNRTLDPITISTRPQIVTTSSSSAPASITGPGSPIITRAKQPDFPPTGGVKSMWGKFSSNASAAFSVVQDAYTGVAKDFMNTGPYEDNGGAEKELRERDALSSWSPPAPRVAPMYMGNPWASSSSSSATATKSLPVYGENPWSLLSDSERLADMRPSPIRALSSDPTIPSIPTVRPTATPTFMTSTASDTDGASRPHPGPETPLRTNANTDPLGVGLI